MKAFSRRKLLRLRAQRIPIHEVLSQMSSSKSRTRKKSPLMRVRGVGREKAVEADPQVIRLLELSPQAVKGIYCQKGKYNYEIWHRRKRLVFTNN